jgi:hypothetical protein
MKCKDVEKVIIALSAHEVDETTKAEIENHVDSCPNCSKFQQNLNVMKDRIRKIDFPEPSNSLISKTLELCHSELNRQRQNSLHLQLIPDTMPTPNFIWAAVVAIVTISIVWFFPVLKEFILGQHYSEQTIWVLTIVVQNVIMLLLAPIILRRVRLKEKSLT